MDDGRTTVRRTILALATVGALLLMGAEGCEQPTNTPSPTPSYCPQEDDPGWRWDQTCGNSNGHR